MKIVRKILDTYLDRSKFEYGFAALYGLFPNRYASYPYGISILRALDSSTIDAIIAGPTRKYFELYHAVNRELNEVVTQLTIAFASHGIPSEGIRATVEENELCSETLSVPVSHKLVATRAGLGWIGKTDLLVSKRFGPRVRLASILTTHPLEVATPIDESQCGACSRCVRGCPARAANGTSWNVATHRDEYFDAFRCRDYCRKITQERLAEELSLCGQCVSVCPYGDGTN